MSMLDKLFKKQSTSQNPLDTESAGKLMLMGILASSTTIFDDELIDYKKRKEQTFELVILSALLILRKIRETLPRHYREFEEDLFNQILIFARHEQIIEKLPSDMTDFINSRFILYDDEFSLDKEGQVKIPVHTVYNLFEKPLLKDSGVCEDSFKVLEIQMKFNLFYKQLMTSFNFMISKKYA